MHDLVTYFMLLGAVGSADKLPFWASSNQFGLMPDCNGALVLCGAYNEFDDSKTFQWRFGASFAANTDAFGSKESVSVTPMIDELYTSLRVNNLPFTLNVGMKHQPMEFLSGTSLSFTHSVLGTLSTTGGHLAWSGNSRTMPGYSIDLEPVAIPFTKKHLWLYGTYGDYKTLDTRYCQGALIHSTKIFFRYDFTNRLSLHIGLDHYAVWGGDKNYTPVSFGNYLRLVTGRSAGSEGTFSDRLNVIGDQGGAELFKLEYDHVDFYAVAQHDIPYADGSGMGFQNFPDGINTLYFGWKDKERWISDIVFEYGYTRYQSGSIHIEEYIGDEKVGGEYTTGIDNYFNNGEYKDGWTYYGRMIGCPLFYTEEAEDEGYTLGIRNNRFRSHHIAVAGRLFRKAPYKLALTHSINYGIYGKPYAGEDACQKPWGSVVETGLGQFSGAFTGEVPLQSRHMEYLALTYGIYADCGEVLDDCWGGSIGMIVLF